MPAVRSILCSVDFSEQSRHALLWASAIAQRRRAELTVLSVLEPLLVQAAGIRYGVDLARTDAQPALRGFGVGLDRGLRVRESDEDEWGRSESLDPDNVGDIADEGFGHRG